MRSQPITIDPDSFDILTDASLFVAPKGLSPQLGEIENVEHPGIFGGSTSLDSPVISSSSTSSQVLLSEYDRASLDLIEPDSITRFTPSTFEVYKMQRASGARFVECLARDNNLWTPAEGDLTPWRSGSESEVEVYLGYARPTAGFLAGVLSYIRSAKAEIGHAGASEDTERGMAAGFLVLSCFSPNALHELLPAVDFRKTCAEGCKYSKQVVSAAARYTSVQLGYMDAVA